MARHVVLGRGPIGRTLTRRLLDEGHEVLVLSRSGGPMLSPGGDPVRDPAGRPVTTEAVDGTDGAALTRAAQGADALHNCVNPAYHRWATDWPPVADALLTAAERTGAVLVVAGNLYGYGRGSGPMAEDSPLRSTEVKGRVRAAMWAEAQRRHRAGTLRAVEVRGSDYLGPEAEEHAHAGPRLLRPLLAGQVLRPIGSADQPHSWTYLPDFARALAGAATHEPAWGRAWHVPSPEPLTYRQVAQRFATAAGAPEPRVAAAPMWGVRAVGTVSPMVREIARIGYQFTEPFVMRSEESSRVLGFAPTSWPTIVAETLAAWDAARATAATT